VDTKQNWSVDRKSGLLQGALVAASPNCDLRPDGVTIDALIIHAISLPPGENGGDDIECLFCNRLDSAHHLFYREIASLKVSSHLLIRRDGSVLQFVPFTQRAWHAGVSRLAGQERVNDFSIGIELEGSEYTPFEDSQYCSLIAVTRALRSAYPEIAPQRILGHSDIAPERKSDPGPYFNWARYRSAVS